MLPELENRKKRASKMGLEHLPYKKKLKYLGIQFRDKYNREKGRNGERLM